MSTITRRDRILGALLGVHAGDALGATVEFEPWENVQLLFPDGVREVVGGGPFGWTPGHATDDTDLTRAVLLAYRDAEHVRRSQTQTGRGAPDVVQLAAQYMADWYDGRWPGRVRGQLVTHDDPHCTIACAAYNATVRALLDGLTPEEAWQAGRDTAERAASSSALESTSRVSGVGMARAARKIQAAFDAGKSLVQVRDLALNGPRQAANATTALPFKASGYVVESLTLAVAALLDPRPLEEVLVDVVRFGRDADTNGAIAGGLLGARDGVDAIPLRWREKLQFAGEFIEVVDDLLSTQESGNSEPRLEPQ